MWIEPRTRVHTQVDFLFIPCVFPVFLGLLGKSIHIHEQLDYYNPLWLGYGIDWNTKYFLWEMHIFASENIFFRKTSRIDPFWNSFIGNIQSPVHTIRPFNPYMACITHYS